MRSILKQTSYLFLAQAFGRVISFFYTIFLARNLGVSDFGLFVVALSYFSIISSIGDFGFNRFLIREITRANLSSSQLIFNTAVMRLMLTAILFAVFSVLLYILDPDKLRVSLSVLAVLTIIPQSLALTFDAVFVARRKLQYSAISLVSLSLSTTILGISLILTGFGVIGAIAALILGQFIYLLILFLILLKEKAGLISSINISMFKQVVLGSLPYGLLAVLGMIYFRVDAIMLSYLRGNFEAGIYGTAYRFFEAAVFIPSAFATALFPVLVGLHKENEIDMQRLYFKSLKLMFLASLLVIGAYLVILPLLIQQFLPKFHQSILAIKILSLAIPFMFIHFPGVQILLATDKYLKPVLILSFFMLSFNIILNLIFIPKFGFVAASWVTVLSEALSFLLFFQFLRMKVLKV